MTRSAEFLASSFAIIRDLCISIVRWLTPRSRPASLLVEPATRRDRTSCSRRVSIGRPGKKYRAVLFAAHGWLFASIPSRMRATMSGPRNGFSKKSSAPFLIASTAMEMSPRPEMMNTGTSHSRAFISFKTSRPDFPGIYTSRRTQVGHRVRSASNRPSPSAKLVTLNPCRESNMASKARTAGSSSTTKISLGW